MAYARHQFELSQPQDDGQPLLAHLEVLQRHSGEVHELLANAPPLPRGCGQVWQDFLELHGSRAFGGMGSPMRVTFADIDSWQRVRGVVLSQWEVGCIRAADDLWLRDYAPRPTEPKH